MIDLFFSSSVPDRTPLFTATATASFNSCIDPIHFSSVPFSSRQIGSGVPQKRERERFQSTRFSSQLPKRPVPVDSGFQLMVLFSSTILSFTAVVRINQLSSG